MQTINQPTYPPNQPTTPICQSITNTFFVLFCSVLFHIRNPGEVLPGQFRGFQAGASGCSDRRPGQAHDQHAEAAWHLRPPIFAVVPVFANAHGKGHRNDRNAIYYANYADGIHSRGHPKLQIEA